MTNREKRCEDCICLISKNGCMCCDELWGRPCNDIAEDECPEDVTLEELQETEQKAKENKISHGAKADGQPKEKKVVKKKISDEKAEIFTNICEFLTNKYDFEVITENKLLKIYKNGKEIKLDFVETRQKKAK